MYLKSLILENVGPIAQLSIEPSFDGELPKPIILVGANGSGKSIALSFIVNLLLHIQQQVFENAEVEKGKVFKLRSPIYIGPAAKYYYGSVTFSDGIGLEEWSLSASKSELVASGISPPRPSWNNIADNSTDGQFAIGDVTDPQKLRPLYSQYAALYFPANRFEEPGWLNSDSLSFAPKISYKLKLTEITQRQIVSSNIFRNLISWIYDLIIDSHLFETAVISVTFPDGQVTPCLLPLPNRPNRVLKGEIDKVLQMIFAGKFQGTIGITVLPKRGRSVGLVETRPDGTTRTIVHNLFSLSSGESLLLALFASIIRDFELSGSPCGCLADIKGIVIVDEVDLHLHIDLQRNVLPRLIRAFPKIQFIVTTHSPLFLLGMEEEFGSEGYDIISLPSGERILAEEFSEFRSAYDVYKNTQHDKQATKQMLDKLNEPCLITEGTSDKVLLTVAWQKLYGTAPCFLNIKSSTDVIGTGGNAQHVQSTLRYVSTLATHPIIGLFDNDNEGNAQFSGLKPPLFSKVSADHRQHDKVSGLLLPAPESRKKYVNATKGSYCYLQIEHYFSDAILEAHNKKGLEVIEGTGVYEIQGDKAAFANTVTNFDAKEFDNFELLFCRLADILGVAPPTKEVGV
ncbi:MAG: AAA family ATPase [Sulfuritalea sp.]|nr:AAA family ATPase [Sulfuritalea sp.]